MCVGATLWVYEVSYVNFKKINLQFLYGIIKFISLDFIKIF